MGGGHERQGWLFVGQTGSGGGERRHNHVHDDEGDHVHDDEGDHDHDHDQDHDQSLIRFGSLRPLPGSPSLGDR